MKPPSTYGTLDTGDPDPEAHAHLLLARMARDLEPLHDEWPDLGTTEAAARAVVMFDRLLEIIESHHRAIKALENHPRGRVPLEAAPCPLPRFRLTHKTRPTPRYRST